MTIMINDIGVDDKGLVKLILILLVNIIHHPRFIEQSM